MFPDHFGNYKVVVIDKLMAKMLRNKIQVVICHNSTLINNDLMKTNYLPNQYKDREEYDSQQHSNDCSNNC